MRTQDKIGIVATIGIVVVMLVVIGWTLPNMGDGSTVSGCGEGTFYHSITNSCELYPELVWATPPFVTEIAVLYPDGTFKIHDYKKCESNQTCKVVFIDKATKSPTSPCHEDEYFIITNTTWECTTEFSRGTNE